MPKPRKTQIKTYEQFQKLYYPKASKAKRQRDMDAEEYGEQLAKDSIKQVERELASV
jgi:hypothetical protein